MIKRETGMAHRPIGQGSDIQVSVVGLGANNFGRRVDLDGTRAVVEAALEAGITLIDTADIYGGQGRSETFLGELLKGRRDQAVLATKFGGDMGNTYGDLGPRGSRRYIKMAIEGSLLRLQTERVDLYQYHFPDGTTPIGETLEALQELIEEGKVRAIGSSNMTEVQVTEADAVARRTGLTPFSTAQNEYSLLERGVERDVAPTSERLGIGLIPYFPLASGLLTGKYRRGEPTPEGSRLAGRHDVLTDEMFDRLEALQRFADDRGLSMLEVAIGWLASRPAVVSVIAGATKPEQVKANAAAMSWTPTEEDLRGIDAIFSPPGEA
jgi:aryl-alcohol dehydrogenase-like predicted oxidoreductase